MNVRRPPQMASAFELSNLAAACNSPLHFGCVRTNAHVSFPHPGPGIVGAISIAMIREGKCIVRFVQVQQQRNQNLRNGQLAKGPPDRALVGLEGKLRPALRLKAVPRRASTSALSTPLSASFNRSSFGLRHLSMAVEELRSSRPAAGRAGSFSGTNASNVSDVCWSPAIAAICMAPDDGIRPLLVVRAQFQSVNDFSESCRDGRSG